MGFDPAWLLLGLPIAFALGWWASRLDLRQWQRERRDSPQSYYQGLNLLLNEQHDKAIDAFIEAVQADPDTSDLHFALGNLFRRRGEFERAVRVHEHLLHRADLPQAERDRAQHALAQDFLKAGLFDRAESAFRALDGTAFDTEARLALLTLHERSRDWRAAAEVAARLEQRGAGSFATRIAHHWCEIALEAEARRQTDDADLAIRQARDAAPQAARPLILAGQRAARAGDHAAAFALWGVLIVSQPAAFNLVARDYARSALATGAGAAALDRLVELDARLPSGDLLDAIGLLDPEPARHRRRLLDRLRRQPSLSSARAWVAARAAADAPVGVTPPEVDAGDEAEAAGEARLLGDALERAARPLRRYRCAACGFEAEHYFWQCPACLNWDSYPPTRLEDQP